MGGVRAREGARTGRVRGPVATSETSAERCGIIGASLSPILQSLTLGPLIRSLRPTNSYCPAAPKAWEEGDQRKTRPRLFRAHKWSSIEQMNDKDVYRWYRPIRAPMSLESYKRLPRHSSYKLEYWDGQLRISPRWRSHGFFLELKPPEACPPVDAPPTASIRPLVADDWERFPEVLAAAFWDSPPLGMLGYRRRLWAARDWLCSTRDGGEGTLFEPACVVAVEPEDENKVLGALLITLMAEAARSWYARFRAAVEPATAGPRGGPGAVADELDLRQTRLLRQGGGDGPPGVGSANAVELGLPRTGVGNPFWQCREPGVALAQRVSPAAAFRFYRADQVEGPRSPRRVIIS